MVRENGISIVSLLLLRGGGRPLIWRMVIGVTLAMYKGILEAAIGGVFSAAVFTDGAAILILCGGGQGYSRHARVACTFTRVVV